MIAKWNHRTAMDCLCYEVGQIWIAIETVMKELNKHVSNCIPVQTMDKKFHSFKFHNTVSMTMIFYVDGADRGH